jgi:3-hydroxybutyryl-CoA dehydrogenase
MNVVILGPGLMGTQIGCEYALGGHTVVMVARRAEAAADRLERTWNLIRDEKLASDADRDAAIERLSLIDSVDAVPTPPDLVVESIVEDLAAKIEVLRDAALRWPNAILASNTSALSITKLGDGAGAGAPARTIGTHYGNPALLMPLVEVIRGEGTSDDVAERVLATLRALGKRPIYVERDVPGFVWNRLQLALLREAVWIAENGVATPDVIDLAIRDGMARRWRFTGPFETAALGGADTFTRIANNLFPELSAAHDLHDLGRWLTKTPAELADIRARRDAGLREELERDARREGR